MPKLIRFIDGRAEWSEDGFVEVPEGEAVPENANTGVILPLSRFQSEGPALLDQGRAVGVRLKSDEAVEALAYDLPRLALVALEFPKFRDGRAYSSAALLRQRYGYTGQIRAVGDVLREQANYMVRCGIDAFEPADGSTPEDWSHVASRFRHVYQAASDGRDPIFVERQKGAADA
jgi:uncharacterized protein (DUF934 family)